MDSNELHKKFSSMKQEELLSYYYSARGLNLIINALGIVSVLLALTFVGPLSIVPAAIIIILLAIVSSGLGDTIKVIKGHILDLTDK